MTRIKGGHDSVHHGQGQRGRTLFDKEHNTDTKMGEQLSEIGR